MIEKRHDGGSRDIMTHAKPQRLLCEIAFELAVVGVIGNPRDRVDEWRSNDSATRHLYSGWSPLMTKLSDRDELSSLALSKTRALVSWTVWCADFSTWWWRETLEFGLPRRTERELSSSRSHHNHKIFPLSQTKLLLLGIAE